MGRRVTLTHGCSLSNLPLFVADGAGLFAAEGLDVEVPAFSAMSSTEELLASGAADLGSVAFTEPLIDSQRDNPLVIVGGSGLMGIAILAQPSIGSVAELRGRALGTFRGDPLEVLLHDALQAAGLSFDDAEIVYLDDFAEALQAFKDGRLAAITLAEPHATRVRGLGAVELSDGTELWGDPFPDTVLVATRRFLAAQPDTVAAALRAMLRAEAMIAADPLGVLIHAERHYPGYTADEVIQGSARQPPCVDIRPYVSTIYGRWPALQSLGLVPDGIEPPADIIALNLLIEELGQLEREDTKAATA